MFLPTLVATLMILGVSMLLISVRVFLVKDGAFKGGCGSNNPMLTDQIGECQVCGRRPGEECKGDNLEAS